MPSAAEAERDQANNLRMPFVHFRPPDFSLKIYLNTVDSSIISGLVCLFFPFHLHLYWLGTISFTMPVGNIYAITAVSVIGGALFGFDISSMSAIINTPAYKCYFNHGPKGPPFNDDDKCSGLSSLAQGGVTAAMPGGSWLGALISGFISDRLGRKYAIMVGCVIW